MTGDIADDLRRMLVKRPRPVTLHRYRAAGEHCRISPGPLVLRVEVYSIQAILFLPAVFGLRQTG